MAGHIRRRGKNSWAVVLDVGTTPEGTRQQRWHSVKGTRKDAEHERTRLLHELQTGSYVEPSRITVGEFLNHWLSNAAKPNVSAKTFERYKEIVDLHLIPAFGEIILTKLSPLHVQNYYAKALEDGRRDGKGGLSAQTVLHHHRVLRQALRRAVQWQVVARNVADAVEPPRAVHREMTALDDAQTVMMLDKARESNFYLPLLIAVSTGMRRGEILALRWIDIDLKGKTVSVRRSLEQTRDRLAFKPPKTQKGRRLIALPTITVDALSVVRREQARQRLALGASYDNNDLVVCKATGEPLKPEGDWG